MRSIAFLATLLILATFAAPAATDEKSEADRLLASKDVRVRARVEPEATIYVGQRARLVIDLMTTTFFKGAPTLSEPEIAYAIVRRESAFAVNASTSLDDRAYAVQSWTFVVYPQRAGAFTVPPLEVTLRVANEDGKTIDVDAVTPGLSFEASVPEAARDLPFVLSAPKFELTDEIDRKLEDLKVGEAFRRTVTMSIDDAPGMLIRPLPTVALDGVAVYPDSPRVDDKTNRGAIRGTRVESVTYVFERAGTYRLPPIEIPWWNLDKGVLEKAVLPAIELSVAVNPELASGAVPPEAESSTSVGSQESPAELAWGALLVAALAVLAGSLLWRRYGIVVRAWVEARHRDRDESEAARFRRFEAACKGGDVAEARRALQVWLDASGDRDQPATTTAFVASASDPVLEREIQQLDERLYGASRSEGAWSGAVLARAVAAARARRRTAKRRTARGETAWDRLNPTGA